MTKITSIQAGTSRKRANIFINGKLTLTIDKQVILNEGLRRGVELSQAQIEGIKEADTTQRCIDAALNFISYRPRSQLEVQHRLVKHGFAQNTIELAIRRLKERDHINDLTFARYWRDNRNSFNPKSKFIIRKELQIKGIGADIVDEVTSEINDDASAYAAAAKKARVLYRLDYKDFSSKLFNYLKWRGFNYEVSNRVCQRLWEERKN